MARDLERAAWVSGVVTVILIIATVILAPSWPDPGSPLKEILAYVSDHHNGLLASAAFAFISVPTFLLFASALRSHLSRGSGGPTAIGFITASAAALAAMVLLNALMGAAIAQRIGEGADEQTVRTLFELFVLSFSALSAATAAFQLAGGVAILVTRALPDWLGWLGIAGGVVSMIGACGLVAHDRGWPVGVGFLGLIGLMIWVLSICTIQLRSAQAG